jgi:hypothetical protein
VEGRKIWMGGEVLRSWGWWADLGPQLQDVLGHLSQMHVAPIPGRVTPKPGARDLESTASPPPVILVSVWYRQ